MMRKKLVEFKDDVVDSFDMFASVPPQLNLNKRESIGTSLGFCASIFIAGVVCLYAYTKFFQLIFASNPNISTMAESGVFSKVTDQLQMKDFKVAFTVKDFAEGTTQNDTSHFAFTALLIEGKPGNVSMKIQEIGTHICDEGHNDLNSFYPPNKNQA
jgi:hypothetical protein